MTEISDKTGKIVQNNAIVNIVTGAFGFSGQRIAERLLARGEEVRTLTNHAPSSASIKFGRLDFGNTKELTQSMMGASVLYNTYWARFAHGDIDHAQAVENTTELIRAAEAAGVKRMVHVSITNPSMGSPLPYFRGKAQVEEAIRSSSLSYAILRPAVLFGEGDILINNIAWLLRRIPLFAIPGRGDYGLQPIFVDDLAKLAVALGERQDNVVIDAIGPETYSYEDLVRLIRTVTGSRSWLVHVSPRLVRVAAELLGQVVGDVVLTEDEIKGLMANLLVSKQAPSGRTSLRAWLQENSQKIGSRYASELQRHY